jgi:hypothetical protein
MARLTDHDQRDAEHALRSEIGLALAQYSRRMLAKGKATITEEIAQASKEGKENLNGITIGKAAAKEVIAEYFAVSKPQAAIDVAATATSEPEPQLVQGSTDGNGTFTSSSSADKPEDYEDPRFRY